MKIIDVVKNIFLRSQIVYVTESADWSIKWDGYYLVKGLKKMISARATTSVLFVKNSIIHFGSVNTFLTNCGFVKVHPSNKIILTWFHVVPGDSRLKFIPELNQVVNLIHTTSDITKNELIKHGFDPDKIVVVPLGVDLESFYSISKGKIAGLKNKLGLPLDKKIIGSFQKDGVGWGEGSEPKIIKGPDLFCKAVIEIAKKFPIHVLLTGPARGYVKKQLQDAGIPFTHNYVKDYRELLSYYNVLDLYLITSRVEGGPKSLLESMACGTPFVTTNVGMVDLVTKGWGQDLVTRDFDYQEIADLAEIVLKDKPARCAFVDKALVEVKKYSWDLIAVNYFNKIYKNFL